MFGTGLKCQRGERRAILAFGGRHVLFQFFVVAFGIEKRCGSGLTNSSRAIGASATEVSTGWHRMLCFECAGRVVGCSMVGYVSGAIRCYFMKKLWSRGFLSLQGLRNVMAFFEGYEKK